MRRLADDRLLQKHFRSGSQILEILSDQADRPCADRLPDAVQERHASRLRGPRVLRLNEQAASVCRDPRAALCNKHSV